MYSFASYRRNVPRFPYGRLVFFAFVVSLFLLLPVLQGPLYWVVTPATLMGASTPFFLRDMIVRNPERTQVGLKRLGIALPVLAAIASQFRDQVGLTALVGLVGATWSAVWFVMMSDDRVVLVEPSERD